MFIDHKGDSILEWVVVLCIAVVVVGSTIALIAKATSDSYQTLDQGLN